MTTQPSTTAESTAPHSTARPSTAVVLGGGGIAGIAWELGVLTGLLEAGLPIADADLVVGTSAGSVVGALLRFGLIAESFAEQLVPVEASGDQASIDGELFLATLSAAIEGTSDEREARAAVGAVALAKTDGATEEERIAAFAARFPTALWPSQPLRVTAVDATDGAFTVFDASSGVELSRALAASCCVPLVWAPVLIDGSPYMDGGMRSGTNADLAAGYDRVLVIACGPELPASPLGPTLTQSVAALRSPSTGTITPSTVLVIEADADSRRAFGPDSLSPATRTPAALAGRAQATRLADDVREFWNASV
jgi:NTE family protein